MRRDAASAFRLTNATTDELRRNTKSLSFWFRNMKRMYIRCGHAWKSARLSTNTGSVPSSSTPHRYTASTGSPAGSTAWRSSRGVPSYCLTMMSSSMVEAPVLYAQGSKRTTPQTQIQSAAMSDGTAGRTTAPKALSKELTRRVSTGHP